MAGAHKAAPQRASNARKLSKKKQGAAYANVVPMPLLQRDKAYRPMPLQPIRQPVNQAKAMLRGGSNPTRLTHRSNDGRK